MRLIMPLVQTFFVLAVLSEESPVTELFTSNDSPISSHSEYQGGHSFRDLSTDEVFEQTARDAEFFVPLA